jgi:hypothetical protein
MLEMLSWLGSAWLVVGRGRMVQGSMQVDHAGLWPGSACACVSEAAGRSR